MNKAAMGLWALSGALALAGVGLVARHWTTDSPFFFLGLALCYAAYGLMLHCQRLARADSEWRGGYWHGFRTRSFYDTLNDTVKGSVHDE